MSLKLIKDISAGTVSFFELSKKQQHSIIQESVDIGDFSALEVVTNTFAGIYDYDEYRPYWLLSDFEDTNWIIGLEVKVKGKLVKKNISWETIILEDGERLTSAKHSALLRAFKYWITATDNPLENGGKLLKPSSVYRKINKVISLINGILLYGESIGLSSNHLQGLNNDFLMSLLTKGVDYVNKDGVYDFTPRVRSLLLSKIINVSDNEAKAFELKYPYSARSLKEEDIVLNLSRQERIKSCCWLARMGFYSSDKSTKINTNRLSGNNVVLTRFLFKNQIIFVDLRFPKFKELMLIGDKSNTEYSAVPNADRSNVLSEHSVIPSISALKLLNVINSKDNACSFPIQAIQSITLPRIKEHVKLNKRGRFKTLPPNIIFNLIKSSYEFTSTFQDAILGSLIRVLEVSTSKSPKHIKLTKNYEYAGSWCERQDWANKSAISLVDNKLIKLGVNKLYISNSVDDAFIARRNNEGLFNLYDVLLGAIQILVGVMMARRQNELVTLKPSGNLSPNIDPASKQGHETDYYLTFSNQKSGSGGQYTTNETLKRPIPRSFALMVWKLELFNLKAMNVGVNKGKLALFNAIDSYKFTLLKTTKESHNNNFDAVCDYFETPLVKFGNGELRRYYVRQHQLRRFFAMIFFWSKSFDGLDTLRWMLGHTDVEHLYHYISESETGGVLKGIKASYLVDAMQGEKLENIDELRSVIAKRYGVHGANISLSTLPSVFDDYDDLKFQTTPSIDSLVEQEKLENQVLELLENDVITLEPEFFTINKNGKVITDFTLTLQVKELD